MEPARAHEHRTSLRVVAVYPTRAAAEAAASAARRAIGRGAVVAIGRHPDLVSSMRGEMREEVEQSTMGPGNVGPFTREMSRGIVWGVGVWTLVFAAIGLPFGLIPMAGLGLGTRLAIAASIGAVVGAVFGFVAGGAAAAKDPATPLAAERGVTVSVDTPAHAADRTLETLHRFDPIRVDRVDGDEPSGTLES